jgi:hypothetical protein
VTHLGVNSPNVVESLLRHSHHRSASTGRSVRPIRTTSVPASRADLYERDRPFKETTNSHPLWPASRLTRSHWESLGLENVPNFGSIESSIDNGICQGSN